MRRNFIFITCLFAGMQCSYGQLKINYKGKVFMGKHFATQDPHGILTASVFGPYGDYRTGSKLAFGDFGRTNFSGNNAFIGEYGSADTDQLWLHGKNGMFLTRGGSNINVIASYLSSGITMFEDVFVPNLVRSSDSRFKKNIQPIESPLTQLLQLNGVKYDYNDKERLDKLTIKSEETDDGGNMTEKETASLENDKNWETERAKSKPQMGFIAQEVQKIFPDLVKEDDLGYLGVDYLSLIPVIVESIREQQQRIEELENKLAGMYEIPAKSDSSLGITQVNSDQDNENSLNNRAFLQQNSPNPFSQITAIKYFLPDNIQKAEINIVDMQGRTVKTIPLTSTGHGSIFIDGSSLLAGTYMYTLSTNGQELDTKKMILTK